MQEEPLQQQESEGWTKRQRSIVFEKSGYVSYANCGLPYYIGGVIQNKEELTLQTPESFWKRFQITMKVRHEVTGIFPERKTVVVKNMDTGESFEEVYDKLLISTGQNRYGRSFPEQIWIIFLPFVQ